jgi:hypothetical protein
MFATVLALNVLLLPDEKIVVPMKMRGPMPGLEVVVNGKGPFHFALDTGGQGQARADSSLVQELDLPIVDKQQARRPGGIVEMAVSEFDSMEIGPLKFSSVRALSRDYNTGVPLPPIKGIIGFGTFKDHLLTLDYPKKKIEISESGLPSPDGMQVLEADMGRGVPTITCTIGGQPVKAYIDSGNLTGAIMLPEETLEKLELTSPAGILGRMKGPKGEIEIYGGTLKGSLKIGMYEISGVTVSAMRGGGQIGNPVIGANILAHFRSTYDQRNGRVMFEKEGKKKFKLPPRVRRDRRGSGVLSI